MAIIAGYDGLVVFATGYTTKIKAWTINFTNTSLDITSFADLWKKKLAGQNEWTGTYSGLIDSTAHSSLGVIGWGEVAATAEFVYDTEGTTNGAIKGTIIVTGWDGSNAVDGVPELSFTFRGSGAPTIEQSV